MKIETFFDSLTSTFSYIVIDEETSKCAIIDSVADYDSASGKISHDSAVELINFIEENNLQLEWILETHIHADHLTAAHYLQEKLGGKIAIGEGIIEVLEYWSKAFNIEEEDLVNGFQFDHIFKDEEIFQIGNLQVKFLSTKGHTPSCGSYLIDNSVFVGDLIFAPNLGTGRTDFPGGSAKEQFASLQKIFSLPKETKIFSAHDYPKNGEKPNSMSIVEIQKKENIFAKITNESEYVQFRKSRDKTLGTPKLLFPSIQINLRSGNLPKHENNGARYLKIPLTVNK
jgi:glyoxylase-like metal-dependent hydrolase (beta-lactamase superfamily II)